MRLGRLAWSGGRDTARGGACLWRWWRISPLARPGRAVYIPFLCILMIMKNSYQVVVSCHRHVMILAVAKVAYQSPPCAAVLPQTHTTSANRTHDEACDPEQSWRNGPPTGNRSQWHMASLRGWPSPGVSYRQRRDGGVCVHVMTAESASTSRAKAMSAPCSVFCDSPTGLVSPSSSTLRSRIRLHSTLEHRTSIPQCRHLSRHRSRL